MRNLFSPLSIRGLEIKNRMVVSPMCQYSAQDGFANEWHFVHLGSRAVSGPGIIFSEGTAVSPEGRITPRDLGIWKDEHIPFLKKITDFIRAQNVTPAMQLAHAGRKASTAPPWEGRKFLAPSEEGWQILAPSAIPFLENDPPPQAMQENDIQKVIEDFGKAAQRATQAGFEILEIHAAHGYLIHEFLSPLSNKREDQYGGSFENRSRLLCEIVQHVRKQIPDTMPLFARLSCTDWVEQEDSWQLKDTIALSQKLKTLGVDLIDASSAGLVPHQNVRLGAGYQTTFAAEIKKQSAILTAAVGLITSPIQADHIITTEQADLIFMAREFLRNPYFPMQAALNLGHDLQWPKQYERAKPKLYKK